MIARVSMIAHYLSRMDRHHTGVNLVAQDTGSCRGLVLVSITFSDPPEKDSQILSMQVALQMTDREKKKLNEKTRKQLEQTARMKADALREDDDVFDVSYEAQGGAAGDVVSATDIKVCCGALLPLVVLHGSHPEAALVPV